MAFIKRMEKTLKKTESGRIRLTTRVKETRETCQTAGCSMQLWGSICLLLLASPSPATHARLVEICEGRSEWVPSIQAFKSCLVLSEKQMTRHSLISFDQLWSARRFKKFEVAGRHLVYRFCDLNLRFGLHRVRLSMHILRSVCLSQRIIRTHPSHSPSHVCHRMGLCLCSGADPWSANGDITEIYWDITFLQFQPRHQASESIALCVQGTLQDLLEAIELQIFEYVRWTWAFQMSSTSWAASTHLHRSFTWKNWTISRKKNRSWGGSWAFYVAEHRIICGLPAWLSMPSGEVKSKMGITEDQWRSAKKDYTDYTLQKHAKKKQDCKEPWTWQPTKDVVNLLASRPNSSAQSLLMALLSALLHYALCTKTGFSRRSASSNTSDWTEPSARTSIHEPSGLNLLWYPAFWGSHKVGRRLQMMDLGCK